MRIIDRIALNRLIKIITDFILALIKIFQKNDKLTPVEPSPSRPKPLKKIIDNIVPWRKKDE